MASYVDGRVVVITGADSGFGKLVAEMTSELGAGRWHGHQRNRPARCRQGVSGMIVRFRGRIDRTATTYPLTQEAVALVDERTP